MKQISKLLSALSSFLHNFIVNLDANLYNIVLLKNLSTEMINFTLSWLISDALEYEFVIKNEKS